MAFQIAANGRELCRIPAAPHINGADPELANVAAWSPDGRRIALGTASILYDAATGQPASVAVTDSMQRFRKEVGGPPISLAWSPDQTRLALGFSDAGMVLLLDMLEVVQKSLAKDSPRKGHQTSLSPCFQGQLSDAAVRPALS